MTPLSLTGPHARAENRGRFKRGVEAPDLWSDPIPVRRREHRAGRVLGTHVLLQGLDRFC